MKIIGSAGRNYIAEVTPEDIAALVGHHGIDFNTQAQEALKALGVAEKSGYDGIKIVIGAEIPVGNRFQRVTEIESKHRELKNTGQQLRAMATLLDQLGDSVIVPPKADVQ